MNQKEVKFHEERRMFCIKDGVLQVAPAGSPDSHASWFMSAGWMVDDPHMIDHVPRGYVDRQENIYFYSGRDFEVNEELATQFLPFVPELVGRLKLENPGHIYGGAVKNSKGEKWVARKDYGAVKCFLR